MNKYIPPPISIALYEPRIPQNTGNIARTCAAFKLPLHLIKPLGFSLDDRYLKRAGLDYWPLVDIQVHDDFTSFTSAMKSHLRFLSFSKSASISLTTADIREGDILLFGREDYGLPSEVLYQSRDQLYIPMPGGCLNVEKGVRSLNLASAVAIASFHSLNKLNFI